MENSKFCDNPERGVTNFVAVSTVMKGTHVDIFSGFNIDRLMKLIGIILPILRIRYEQKMIRWIRYNKM